MQEIDWAENTSCQMCFSWSIFALFVRNMKDGFLLHHRAFEHCVDNSNKFAAFLVCLIAELMPLSQARCKVWGRVPLTLAVTTAILLGKWQHPLFPLPPFALMEREPRRVACVNVCFDCTSPSGLEFLPSAGMLHCHRGVQNRMTTGVMVVTEIAGAHASPALSLFFPHLQRFFNSFLFENG